MPKEKKNYEYYLAKVKKGEAFVDPAILSMKNRKGHTIAMALAEKEHAFTDDRTLLQVTNDGYHTVAAIMADKGILASWSEKAMTFNNNKAMSLIKRAYHANECMGLEHSDVMKVYISALEEHSKGHKLTKAITTETIAMTPDGWNIYQSMMLSNKRNESLFEYLLYREGELSQSACEELYKQGYTKIFEKQARIEMLDWEVAEECDDALHDALFHIKPEVFFKDISVEWLEKNNIDIPLLTHQIEKYGEYLYDEYYDGGIVIDLSTLTPIDNIIVSKLVTLPKLWHGRRNLKEDRFVLEYIIEMVGQYHDLFPAGNVQLAEHLGQTITYKDVYMMYIGTLPVEWVNNPDAD